MDRISDSGSDGCGSIPHGGTNRQTCCLPLFGTYNANTIMKKIIFSIAALFAAATAFAQVPGEDTYIHYDKYNKAKGEEIRIPDFGGYITLKGDFHIHTAFSDGNVWPSYRVDEAKRTGLDVIAITDHIEYRPKKEYFSKKVDLNTSYEIAAESAGDDLIVVHGTEITRGKPFGHMNALFVEDANKADVKEPIDALEAMVEQGAYIIWNHPGWPDDKCTMYPVHEELIAKGKIHGVEIWNDYESYPIAYDWVEAYGLHPFANSDIHGSIRDLFVGTRPMTLVFAKEKSLEGVKEAMFAGRTLALYNNFLMGKQEFIAPLVKECLKFEVKKDKGDYVIYRVHNSSDIRYQMQFGDNVHQVTVEPRDYTEVEIAKGQTIIFVNCILAKGKYHSISQSEL